MSWEKVPMPKDRAELEALLTWAHQKGRVVGTEYRTVNLASGGIIASNDPGFVLSTHTPGHPLERRFWIERYTAWRPWSAEPCDVHARYTPGCDNCVEAGAYCPHGRIMYHPDAPLGAPCWRPLSIGEVWSPEE